MICLWSNKIWHIFICSLVWVPNIHSIRVFNVSPTKSVRTEDWYFNLCCWQLLRAKLPLCDVFVQIYSFLLPFIVPWGGGPQPFWFVTFQNKKMPACDQLQKPFTLLLKVWKTQKHYAVELWLVFILCPLWPGASSLVVRRLNWQQQLPDELFPNVPEVMKLPAGGGKVCGADEMRGDK